MKVIVRLLVWTVGLALTGLLIAGLVYYEPDRSVAELAQRWAPPPSTFVGIGGVQAHVRDEGPRDAALTFVLLHGTGSSLHTWNGWVADLQSDCRVLPRFIIEQSVINVYGDPARIEPGLVDRYLELTTREGNRAALIRRFEQFQPGAQSERVGELQQPTLLIWGAKDRLVPLAVGERFDREIPDSTLIVFDDLGHVPHEEAPAQTVAAVREWLGE